MLREFVPEPAYSTTDEDTVFALLSRRAKRDPDDLIAQWQDDGTRRWHDVTAGEMLERVRAVAKGLLGLGVKAGSMVVIYSPTCYEWGVIDFACAAIGAVSVPVYETDSARQAASIIEEVDPIIAFAGDSAHTQTLEQIRDEHSSLRYVFNFKADGLDAVADFGEGVGEDTLDQVISRVKADDMLTIVYTSGSTGKPKGAMLSHRNFTHIVLNGYIILDEMLYQPNRLMLFLPFCFGSEHEISGLWRRSFERRSRPFLQRYGWHYLHSGLWHDGNRRSHDCQLAGRQPRRFRRQARAGHGRAHR